MDAAKVLTHETLDSRGFTAEHQLVGRSVRHNGNGKTYVVLGLCWLGASDEWGFLHREAHTDGVLLCRPLSHFNGDRDNGQARYTRL